MLRPKNVLKLSWSPVFCAKDTTYPASIISLTFGKALLFNYENSARNACIFILMSLYFARRSLLVDLPVQKILFDPCQAIPLIFAQPKASLQFHFIIFPPQLVCVSAAD